jgi:hypothetical protein
MVLADNRTRRGRAAPPFLMPETQPVDAARTGASPDPEREARIEELLLAGLDQYFAGRFEQAITIWTRVAFLERGHGRARAYIERARGAQAERQRESEELVHQGVAAYDAGELETARALLTRAIEEGGPTDIALAFLQRLNRVDTSLPDAAPVPGRSRGRRRRDATAAASPSTRWLATILASVALAVVIFVAGSGIASWIAELPIAAPAIEPIRPEPLPVARPSEMLLARAHGLHARGQLTDALRVLDRIGSSDALAADADRLRAEVQRELLAAAGVPLETSDVRGPARLKESDR